LKQLRLLLAEVDGAVEEGDLIVQEVRHPPLRLKRGHAEPQRGHHLRINTLMTPRH